MPVNEQRSLVEALIQAARQRGDFDNLPGHGKPLQLDDLAGLSEEQRFEVLLLRSVGEVPVEVLLAREIRACRDALTRGLSRDESERMQQALHAKVDELLATLEARRSSACARARKVQP